MLFTLLGDLNEYFGLEVTCLRKQVRSRKAIHTGSDVKNADDFSQNLELKHRRFRATDVNRKSKLLLSDAYYSFLVKNFKL